MNLRHAENIGDGSSDRCAVEEDAFGEFSFNQRPAFLTKVRNHGGWDNHQPAAMDANLRWQSGVLGGVIVSNCLIPAHAGISCHESCPSLQEVPACAGMSEYGTHAPLSSPHHKHL